VRCPFRSASATIGCTPGAVAMQFRYRRWEGALRSQSPLGTFQANRWVSARELHYSRTPVSAELIPCNQGESRNRIAGRSRAPNRVPRSVFDRADGKYRGSVVPVGPLHTLVSFLRLDAQSGDRSSLEAADADRFVCLFAISVGTVVDPVKRRVDLGD